MAKGEQCGVKSIVRDREQRSDERDRRHKQARAEHQRRRARPQRRARRKMDSPSRYQAKPLPTFSAPEQSSTHRKRTTARPNVTKSRPTKNSGDRQAARAARPRTAADVGRGPRDDDGDDDVGAEPDGEEARAERLVLRASAEPSRRRTHLVVARRLLDLLVRIERRDGPLDRLLERGVDVLLGGLGNLGDGGALAVALLGLDRRQRVGLVRALGAPADVVQVGQAGEVSEIRAPRRTSRSAGCCFDDSATHRVAHARERRSDEQVLRHTVENVPGVEVCEVSAVDWAATHT